MPPNLDVLSQNVAVKGTTVGYYLFRRSETNKRETSNPWEQLPGDGPGGEPNASAGRCCRRPGPTSSVSALAARR